MQASSANPPGPAAKPSAASEVSCYFGLLFDPSATLRRLRQRPTWLFALVFTLVAMGVASAMQQPAVDHVRSIVFLARAAQGGPAADQLLEAASAEHTTWFAAFLIGIAAGFGSMVVSWLYYWTCGRVFGQDSPAEAWALTLNCFVLVILTALTNSLILLIIGYEHAVSFKDLFVIPALGDLVKQPTVAIALSVYNPINLWYYIEATVGLHVVLDLTPWAAVVCVAFWSLLTSVSYWFVATTYQALMN